jgi:AAA15 family ATPase/GTPase
MELGRVTVLIGENGSGKSNILEAIAMGAAAHANRLEAEDLYNRGMRIAKPSITFSSFRNTNKNNTISLSISHRNSQQDNTNSLSLNIVEEITLDQKTKWICKDSPSLIRIKIDKITNQTLEITEALRAAELARRNFEEEYRTMLRTNADDPRVGIARTAMEDLATRIDGIKVDITDVLSFSDQLTVALQSKPTFDNLEDFVIFSANHFALRGLETNSRKEPVGLNGENLDVFLAGMDQSELKQLNTLTACIPWFKGFFLDKEDSLKFSGFKPGRSTSRLYFRDRFMQTKQNIFSAENANEGILHILFYASIFISRLTPTFFAIDNIETALNPQLCRELITRLTTLAKEHNKQAIITTHNPAVLDGLNLHDDDQRLLVVYRNDEGHTVTRRIKVKPESSDGKYKLSELWMRGHLGGIPKTF